MPKVSTENSEAPTRAPRKRAVRRVVPKGDAPVRRTRTVASAPKEAAPRKAPVRVRNELAPVVLHYIKVEASHSKISNHPQAAVTPTTTS